MSTNAHGGILGIFAGVYGSLISVYVDEGGKLNLGISLKMKRILNPKSQLYTTVGQLKWVMSFLI